MTLQSIRLHDIVTNCAIGGRCVTLPLAGLCGIVITCDDLCWWWLCGVAIAACVGGGRLMVAAWCWH